MESVKETFAAFSQSRFSDALSGFNGLLEQDATNAYHLINRASCYFALELYRKAVGDCDAAIKINPNLERAYLLKGRSQWKMGKQKIARKTWRQGCRIMSDVNLFKELVNCLGGDIEEADSKPSVTVPIVPQTNEEFQVFNNSKEADMLVFQRPEPKQVPKLDSKQFDVLATAAVGQIQHGVGDLKVDKIIALGYFYVNSGKLIEAIQIFDSLLKEYPQTVAAHLGRGTAYALAGQLDYAITDFGAALAIEPKCVDAYKRRGQTRAARGFEKEALEDFSAAIELGADHEAYHQRGLVYYRMKNYKRAVADFEIATRLDHSDPLTWNHMGLCYDSLGDCKSAVESHLKAISLRADFKEAYVNLGQAYKDWGRIEEALENFNKGLSFDDKYAHGYHLRGLAYFGVGEHYLSMQDLQNSVKFNPGHVDVFIMLAVIKHGLGMIKEAVADYEKALQMDPQNPCWYQKEIALWWHHRLDQPNESHNMDLDLDPQFKEYWCKRHAPSLLKVYQPQPPINPSIPDVVYSPTPKNKNVEDLLKYSYFYGTQLHQDAPGYLSNKRQQRMAGLATIDIAQRLRQFWFAKRTSIPGRLATGKGEAHKSLSYRFIYDIVIRWRQFSEPNDPVWWVDCLTPEQFAEGFGSHTPMITGQCNVVRYSPMISLSFPIMKDEMIKQKNLSEKMKQKVREAKNCDDLYDIMRQDFWIVTPCYSLRTGRILEGTRLTLQRTEPEGYEYSIRTPGTPPRWIDYDLELIHVFDLLTQEVRNPQMDFEKVSDLILTVTFYWYNFMPLSRGTAACGYIVLNAMFLAIGYKINRLVPTKFLVDWQGILRPKPELFIEQLKPWMYPAREKVDISEFEKLPSVAQTFPTIRTMIEVLNCKNY